MLLDRAFAALYDRVLAPTEQAGLTEIRAQTLAGLAGVVVEIGAGTGLNVAHYPSEVTELHLCEPSAPMAQRLRARLADEGATAAVVDAPGRALPFADASVDHVVSTLVLCTVDDLSATCRELARVLRPGGTLRLIEHIGTPDGWLGTTQRVVEPGWKVVARGCHLTRDPREELASAGFDLADVRDTTMPAPQLTRRTLVGTAVRA